MNLVFQTLADIVYEELMLKKAWKTFDIEKDLKILKEDMV